MLRSSLPLSILSEANRLWQRRNCAQLSWRHLADDFRQPLKLSSYKVAKELGVAAPTVNGIVRRRRSIRQRWHCGCPGYFRTSAQLWRNQQTQYDLEIAAKELARRLSAQSSP